MRTSVAILFNACLALLPGTLEADYSQPSLPVMRDVTAASDVQYDAQTKIYTYRYMARNGATSTGSIGSFFLENTVPDRTDVPQGWISDQRKDGSLMVSYAGTGPGKPLGSMLMPGGKLGFSLTSTGQPVIKTLRLRADWIPEEDGPEDDATHALYSELETKVRVLAPGTEKVGSFEHWSRFRDDLVLAAQLGWLPDAQFATTVSAELGAARKAFDAEGPHGAEASLKALLASVEASTPAQRSTAGYALLELNAQALLVEMHAAPATTGTVERGATFRMQLDDASERMSALGYQVSFSGRLTDRADDDKPVAGYPVSLFVGMGPDKGARAATKSDTDGRFTLAYAGKAQGIDYAVMGDAPYSVTVLVTWAGGPDLVMDGFVIPMIQWRGFGPIYFHDTVANAGSGPAGPSTVRYYASLTQPVDLKTARVVWMRQVPALKPDEVSEAPKDPGTFPTDLPPGLYYLTACVTEDSGPPESHLSNNCENGSGGGMRMMIAAPVETTHPRPPR